MSSSDTPQFSRTTIYVSLGLAILLIVGALLGARIISDRASNQPVGMSALPAPLAESQECTQLVEDLPDSLVGHDRATIAEPVPPGTAAWQTSEIERVTLRCGIDLPLQYNEYAQTEEIGGVEWIRVDDMTPESTMATWYSVDREPVVAVTADDMTLGNNDNPVADLGEQISALPEVQHEPQPGPLSDLQPAQNQAEAAETCSPLLDGLPETLAEEWTLAEVDGDTAAWVNYGNEPIVIRCGVAPPPNYVAGERLTQIDDIPWFEDEQLVNGSTASNWYALGRATDIAVSVPQAASSVVLPELGRVISENTPEQAEQPEAS